MLTVGLTGGIGAGKSVVARRLVDHGAVLIDADQLAREVVAPGTAGLAEVVALFGADVLGADGALDRTAVGAAVFRDSAARRRLERIIHPRVRARTAELIAAAPADAVVVNDVPLLVESGLAASYHLVVVVEATEATRTDRLVRKRGMRGEDARARIRAQAGDAERRAAADVLLTNDGALADLHAAVDALWHARLVPFEENVRERSVAQRSEELRLVPYDPIWPEQYRHLAARVRRAAGKAAVRVDHIGSTAVPGLAAKDVIDMQLTVADLATADELAEPLARAGFPRFEGRWHDNPKPEESEAAAWEKRMHGNADPGRAVNLHVRPVSSPGMRGSLLLRDWLRADATARDGYAALKQRLRERGLPRSQYGQHKEPWFDQAWQRARRWAADTGWQP
jgi:dephospho-CoA kinase